METKTSKTISYEFISRSLGLREGPQLRYFDLRADDRLVSGAMERSIVLSDVLLVWLCRKGSCSATVSGMTHKLSAGQMLIVFQGTYCRFHSVSADFEASTVVGQINPKATYNSLSIAFPKILALPILTLNNREYTTLLALFEYVRTSLLNPDNAHRKELDVGILAILHDELSDILLRSKFELRGQTPDEQLVKKFRLMLSVGTFEHRDVEYYAQQFGLTPKRFAVKVKKVTGSTPSEMINTAVVTAAKRYLACTDLSTTEISNKLNFATPSFFCRYFRRYTKTTPSEWREKNASKE